MKTTLERLQAMLVRDYQLDPALLVPDALLEGLGIDSLGAAELLFNIEDEFKIVLPPEQVHLPAVADVVAFIDRLVLEQAGGAPVVAVGSGA